MRKVLSFFLSALLLLMVPIGAVQAKTNAEGPADLFTAQLKDRKKLISEKINLNKKLQTQINKKSSKAADQYLLLFGGASHPSAEDTRKVEMMEMELGRIAQHLILNEKAVNEKVKEANMALGMQHYEHALMNYDSVIALLDKQTDILKKQNELLQAYIDFLQSLKNK